MAEQAAPDTQNGKPKKQILLNAFDMSTVGHLSPGQWKVFPHNKLLIQDAKRGHRTPKIILQRKEA
jgi:hypothetical protein